MPEGFRCSDASVARDEPLYGTASFVRRWLLVEQPGSWGSDALSQSRMPAKVASELRARARSLGVRVVLIRRGARLSTGRRQCYLLRTGARESYAAHLSVDAVSHLLDIDLSPLRNGGEVPGATPLEAPVFLVCTHGRHDACCSIKGNQVSRIACAQPGFDGWECSHIGGDRFAANLVCFPHGVYYGRVDTGDVLDLMDSYREGRIDLEHYRGRCCFPFPLQAAEYFVRRELAATGLDDVAFVTSSSEGSILRAVFSVLGRTAEVVIGLGDRGEHRLTCGAAGALPIPSYDLASLTVLC